MAKTCAEVVDRISKKTADRATMQKDIFAIDKKWSKLIRSALPCCQTSAPHPAARMAFDQLEWTNMDYPPMRWP